MIYICDVYNALYVGLFGVVMCCVFWIVVSWCINAWKIGILWFDFEMKIWCNLCHDIDDNLMSKCI